MTETPPPPLVRERRGRPAWTMAALRSMVRPAITILAMLLVVIATLCQIDVPVWVQRICDLVIGFYFLSRAQEAGARQVKESQP